MFSRLSDRFSGASLPSVAVTSRPIALFIGVVAILVLVLLLTRAIGCAAGGGAADENGEGAAAQSEEGTRSYSISFASTGDLIFWREVGDYIDMYGGASAMENIDDMLAEADVTIANVESPLSDNDSEPIADKDVYIIGRPSAIESIKNSDITIASLANNHIMDYSGPALQDTIDALDEAGVLHAGAGMTEDEADKMVELTVDGVSIAFFSWTDIVPENFVAYDDNPGVASARLAMDDACRRVSEAKETHDVVIVAMHWGVEYEDYIDEELQREPAHKLADAGADVILGNHPHVMEGVEFYNGTFIAYAHGNCVFWQKYDHTHESIILNFDMTDEGVKNVVATPLYLDDTYGIPSVSTGEQAQTTLERLQEISADMNVNIEIRDDKAYITPAS